MNPHKFSVIAHRDHAFCNPTHAAKIGRILEILPFDAERAGMLHRVHFIEADVAEIAHPPRIA